MRRFAVPFGLVVLMTSWATAAQETEPREALEWAVALSGRFRQLHNPVVASYAIGRLASLICSKDKVAASGLFREALARLSALPDSAFNEAGPVLPVSSFSGLWKFVVPEAQRCDPALSGFLENGRIRARITAEHQEANANLSRALGMIESRPDRAAQLADASISAGDPRLLEIETLTKFLAQLRDRAPDLADDLFPKALDLVASAAAPSPGLLSELGKYLFTAPQLLEKPDKELAQQVFQIGGSSVANLTAARHSTNPDDVRSYIESGWKLLTATRGPDYDPVVAYAIGYQLLPKARDIAPDFVERLEKAIAEIEPQVGAYVGRVQSLLGGTPPPDPEGGDTAIRRDRTIRRVLSAVFAKRFDDARELLSQVDIQDIRRQIDALIDFGEAARAIERRDIQLASQLVNAMRAGVKRSLLYAGIISAASRDVALEEVALAVKDTEELPAEQRVVILSAIATATLQVDVERALTVLNQLVASSNDANTRPRRARFNPKIVRAVYSGATDASNDSALILFSSRGLYEVLDSGLSRHHFSLRVPGVSSFNLPAVLQNAVAVEPKRLEALVLALRDENRLAGALNELAALRLKHDPLSRN